MPYILPCRRKELDPPLTWLGSVITSPGELNYVICRLYTLGIENLQLANGSPPNYAELSAALAAVRDAADEIQRRVLVPYERTKQFANGDVFGDLPHIDFKRARP